MLQNEYLVAKIGVDTAENEPSEVSQKLKHLGGGEGVLKGGVRGHQI